MQQISDLTYRLDSVSSLINEGHKDLERQKGSFQTLKSEIENEKKNIAHLAEQKDLAIQVRDFLSVVLRKTETNIEDLFGGIGSAAIQSVFSEDRKLKFQFEMSSSGISVKIGVVNPSDDGDVEVDPDFESGGIRDVVALALRIAMLELYVPRQEGPLILDESIKFLADDEAIQGVGEFLKKICDETGRQMIVVTHKHRLASYADKSFTLTVSNGKSNIQEMGVDEEDDD